MDCESAKLLLYFYRPGRNTDLAAEDVAALETHLSTCTDCRIRGEKAAASDQRLAPAIQRVPVPAGLAEQLLASANRSARLQTLFRATAAATVLGIGLLSYQLIQRALRPSLDAWSAANSFETGLNEPTAAVLDWFQREGIPGPSEDFDLRKAVAWGDAELNGKKVPTLTLQSGTEICRVHFVRPGAMSTAGATAAQTSSVTLKWNADSPDTGWTTVILYTGASLNPFLRPQAQPF
jgi:hypothetical protein